MTNNATPPELPTQVGPRGIRYDFNNGLRLMLPKGNWHIEVRNEESDLVLWKGDSGEGWVISPWKYYLPLGFAVWNRDDSSIVLQVSQNLTQQQVMMAFSPQAGLGDLMAWIPVVEAFRKKHQCRIVCAVGNADVVELFKNTYPDFQFVTPSQADHHQSYAAYPLGIHEDNPFYNPTSYKIIGLQQVARDMLGIDGQDIQPDLVVHGARPVPEKYVCIAVQSTAKAKLWNHPHGWDVVVADLKARGYRVLCIDREPSVRYGSSVNTLPKEAEDWTGPHPLISRANLLKHAEFFIGLGSGLSWLAWACHTPVLLISGFSLPLSEFHTPWRVINRLSCNGCWNRYGVKLGEAGLEACPDNKEFVCTTSITPRQVIVQIEQLAFHVSQQRSFT